MSLEKPLGRDTIAWKVRHVVVVIDVVDWVLGVLRADGGRWWCGATAALDAYRLI